jgi:hypothetical protein
MVRVASGEDTGVTLPMNVQTHLVTFRVIKGQFSGFGSFQSLPRSHSILKLLPFSSLRDLGLSSHFGPSPKTCTLRGSAVGFGTPHQALVSSTLWLLPKRPL